MNSEPSESSMPAELLFSSEQEQDRDRVAASLRTIADRLEAGEPVTFTAGDQSETLRPAERTTLEITITENTDPGTTDSELRLEFALEWDEEIDDETDGVFTIT